MVLLVEWDSSAAKGTEDPSQRLHEAPPRRGARPRQEPGHGPIHLGGAQPEPERLDAATHQLTLSLYCPGPQELDAPTLEASAWSLLKRGGYIAITDQPDAMRLRKKSVFMLAEGSVFPAAHCIVGRTVDLQIRCGRDLKPCPAPSRGPPHQPSLSVLHLLIHPNMERDDFNIIHHYEIETLSPLHIGSGDSLRRDFDYLEFSNAGGNSKTIALLDHEKVLRIVGEGRIGEWVQQINAGYPTLKWLSRYQSNLNSTLVSLREIEYREPENMPEFKTMITDAHGLPYLPGSSLLRGRFDGFARHGLAHRS
ncbi:MAG: RAMP superfamily CRISPR-associated protein [Bacteroidia bacterium]